MAPSFSSWRRSSSALVRLPLWHRAMVPRPWRTIMGWALARTRLPEVAYRTCPVAMRAVGFAREASTAGVNTSLTSPRSRWPWITPSSLTAMPQLSWPRCCSAYRAE